MSNSDGILNRGRTGFPSAVNALSAADAQVAERFGFETYAKRTRMEIERERIMGSRLRWCPVPIMAAILRVVLKMLGLWERGRREYLSPVVETRHVSLSNLPAGFEGYTVLHLSDMHLDLDGGTVEAIISAVRNLSYDAVALTGDFNNLTVHPKGNVTEKLSRIVSVLHGPVFGVLGNHDSLFDVPFFESAGIRMLLNEHFTIRRGSEALYFVGVDDPNKFKTDDLEKACAGIPSGACRLLLSHSPSIYKKAAAAGIDFVMSGHLHGGQIRLPNGLMIHLRNDTSPRRFWIGEWKEDRTQGWTSRGLGGCGVPVRLNCPPEVALHVLHRGR